jgi:outer membrane protein assembly factor BamB
MLGGSRAHPSSSSFLEPSTNETAWRFEAQGPVRGGAAIDTDGTIFFGSVRGRLFAVEQNGVERWSVKGLGRIVSVPALGNDGRIYASSASGKLYAMDAKTDARVWIFDAGLPITTSAVLGADGAIYFGTGQGGVFAVAPDGTRRWQAPVGKIAGSAPAIGADGTLFVGTVDGRVVAIDSGGAVRWETATAQAKRLGTPVQRKRICDGIARKFVTTPLRSGE